MDCGPYAVSSTTQINGNTCIINDISCCCPKPIYCISGTDVSCNSCCNEQWISDKTVQCNNKNKFTREYPIPKGRGGFTLLPPTRNQNGQWNGGLTNTKMFPIISKGFHYGSKRDMSTNPEERTHSYFKTTKQSGNLFKNTYVMSKKQVMAYLSKNAGSLKRVSGC